MIFSPTWPEEGLSLDAIHRNQWQSQGVEPAQHAVQSGLVHGAGQGGDRWILALTLDRYRHPLDPV